MKSILEGRPVWPVKSIKWAEVADICGKKDGLNAMVEILLSM